jgi:hypothetical protein
VRGAPNQVRVLDHKSPLIRTQKDRPSVIGLPPPSSCRNIVGEGDGSWPSTTCMRKLQHLSMGAKQPRWTKEKIETTKPEFLGDEGSIGEVGLLLMTMACMEAGKKLELLGLYQGDRLS